MLERWIIASLIICALIGARLLLKRFLSRRFLDHDGKANFDTCITRGCKSVQPKTATNPVLQEKYGVCPHRSNDHAAG